MRHSHLLGSKEPIFYKIFESLKQEMSRNYPELERSESLIKETLKMEEEKFLVLLDRGIKILNDEISKIDKVLPGDVAFKLYDTFGFPLDLTEDILRNRSLSIDTKKFKPFDKTKYQDGVIRFLFIARLLRDKGLLEYAKASKKICNYETAEFYVLGSFYPDNPSAINKDDMKPQKQLNG